MWNNNIAIQFSIIPILQQLNGLWKQYRKEAMNQLKNHTHNNKNKAKRLRATNFTINREKSKIVIAVLENYFAFWVHQYYFCIPLIIILILSHLAKRCAETKRLTFVKQCLFLSR